MISPDHVRLMARYNRWQNTAVAAEADLLTDAQRREMRGIFWGSIHRTLTHLLWADQNWMGRFTGKPAPWFDYGAQPWPKIPKQSVDLEVPWDEWKQQRAAYDQVISDWAAGVDPAWLASDFSYTNSTGRQVTFPNWLLVTHLFNHQTHHRGQVHALLTQLGCKTDDTDIPWMPASF